MHASGRRPGSWRRWTLVACGALVALVLVETLRLLASYRVSGVSLSFGDALSTAALDWAPWAVLGPLAALLWRALRRTGVSGPAALLVHTLAAPLFGAAHVGSFAAITVLVRGDPWHAALRSAVLVKFTASTLTYACAALVAHALAARAAVHAGERRRAELTRQLDGARLDALRARLQPHFLFNALNGIAGVVHTSPRVAEDLIVRLGALLRGALSVGASGDDFVTLAEERSLLADYLALEGLRLGPRLRACVDLPDELGSERVPRLLLQPLVENAIVHGIARRGAGGALVVRARRIEGRRAATLRLEVENDGPDAECHASASARTGFGLTSTRERLALLYGERARIDVARGSDGRWSVVVEVPCST